MIKLKRRTLLHWMASIPLFNWKNFFSLDKLAIKTTLKDTQFQCPNVAAILKYQRYYMACGYSHKQHLIG